MRILSSVVCAAVASFSVFGFVASFEPGVPVGWKIGYAVVFCVMVAAAIAPWMLHRSAD